MIENKKIRLLIISNNCLSLTNSNGRTLFNFVSSFANNEVANFYIHDEMPNLTTHTNFYRVTDREALSAYKSRIPIEGLIGKKDASQALTSISKKSRQKTKKNPLTSLAREIIWNSAAWKAKSFEKWIDDFSPTHLLLQAGDAPFLFRLARKIAKKRNIPLIIYNSEDYYFKEYNYMERKYSFLYPFFRHRLVNDMKKTIRKSSLCIYISEALMNHFIQAIPHRADYIMTSSSFSEENQVTRTKSKEEVNISYLGNFNLGRELPLIEIATLLNKRNLKLHVYGNGNEETVEAIKQCSAIIYHGFATYDGVKEVMRQSSLLIHVEAFSDYAIKDLRFSFSTKIADSLSSRVPFLVYIPKELACNEYLKMAISDFVVNNPQDLESTLNNFLDGKLQYPNGKLLDEVIEKNHSLVNNQNKFRNLLASISCSKGAMDE
ncbi:MAG: hypothetical protein WC215_00390 [Bacilli bacterium]